MDLITILKGPAALILTAVMGWLMIRTVIWITQRHDE